MRTAFTNSSRRFFLQRIAIASTAFIALPTVLWAKNATKLLRFAIAGNDSGIANAIEESDKMALIDDLKFADVIYVSGNHQKSQNYFQEMSSSGKYLIIEDHENNALFIENYRKLGNSLTIVARSTDSSKLFENATYYECSHLKLIDIQKVINILAFLEQHTTPLQFRIKTGDKPLEMLVS